MKWFSACGVIFLGMILLCGCGGSGLTTVEGEVLYDGQPLEKGSIFFSPVAEGRPAKSDVQNGNFSLITDGESGVFPGKYFVYFDVPAIIDDEIDSEGLEEVELEIPIPKRFLSRQDSLIKEVKAGQKNHFKIEIPAE